MYFSTAVAFVALPFLVGAVPVSLNSPQTGAPVSIPLNKLVNYLNLDGSVNNEKLEAGLNHTKARFEHTLRAYERNTGRPHPYALNRTHHSNEPRAFIPVPLTSHSNVLWTADIAVGTPAKSFTVVLDTVLPDMFIPSINCLTCDEQNVYDINFSSSGMDEHTNRTANFGIGEVTGDLIFDDVFVGGFQATNHLFLVATEIDPVFQPPITPADGFMGLGLKGAALLAGENSVVGDIINQNGFANAGAQPVFGFIFTILNPEFVIGGTDTSKFSGELSIVPLTSPDFWEFELSPSAITANGNTVTLPNPATIVVDTSNAFITAPSATISSLYSNIPGSAPIPNSGQWTIPCETSTTITISIGGTDFHIPPTAYNLGPVVGSDNLCTGGFAVLDNGPMKLGTVGLQNLYVQFDQGNMQIGFAPLAS